MRNWNCFMPTSAPSSFWFSAYLWGIETTKTLHYVQIVEICFQPTYEELKHNFSWNEWRLINSFSAYLWGIETQPEPEEITESYPEFSAYLWGIETYNNTNLVFLENNVFSLPMRNWNVALKLDQVERIEEVFSLPMRNWNRGLLTFVRKKVTWVFSLPMRNWNFSFFSAVAVDILVFSLPMRNWNEESKKVVPGEQKIGFQPTYEELKLPLKLFSDSFNSVFSLPMRNWNFPHWIWTWGCRPFSAYLWGIETR